MDESIRHGIVLAETLREVHERDGAYGCLAPLAVVLTGNGAELAPRQNRTVTCPYSAPEQLLGTYDDPRSDLFAAGALLYEMLGGRKAFASATAVGLREAILTKDPEELASVPAPLAKVLAKCLEKRPERRFQSAQLLLLQLKMMAARQRAGKLGLSSEGHEKRRRKPRVNGHARQSAGIEVAVQDLPEAAVEAADGQPVRKRVACPRCKAEDTRPSRPRGRMEEILGKVGVRFSRCHRCYERFLHWGFAARERSE